LASVSCTISHDEHACSVYGSIYFRDQEQDVDENKSTRSAARVIAQCGASVARVGGMQVGMQVGWGVVPAWV